MMRWRTIAAGLIAVAMATGNATAQSEMTWQEAIAELSAERTRAETCVSLLKRHAGDDAAALSQGEIAYTEAKADTDAVIAQLIVALAEGEDSGALSGLGAKMTGAFLAREAFCEDAMAFVPQDSGSKSVIVAVLGTAAVGALITGIVTLYKQSRDEDALRRKTIQTQLEGVQWKSFGDIAP